MGHEAACPCVRAHAMSFVEKASTGSGRQARPLAASPDKIIPGGVRALQWHGRDGRVAPQDTPLARKTLLDFCEHRFAGVLGHKLSRKQAAYVASCIATREPRIWLFRSDGDKMREFWQKDDLNLLPAGYRSEARPKKNPSCATARSCATRLRAREKRSHRFAPFSHPVPTPSACRARRGRPKT
jgi:hypothetical protein